MHWRRGRSRITQRYWQFLLLANLVSESFARFAEDSPFVVAVSTLGDSLVTNAAKLWAEILLAVTPYYFCYLMIFSCSCVSTGFHSQEWLISNFPCSAASPEILHTYSDESMIIVPILTTSLTHFSFRKLGVCTVFELGSERVKRLTFALSASFLAWSSRWLWLPFWQSWH